MPQPEQAEQKEAAESKNSFPLSVDAEGRELMTKWSMEIKDDKLFLNGKPQAVIEGTKQMTITAVGNTLVWMEVTKSGETFTYKGDDPEMLADNMVYTGTCYFLDKKQWHSEEDRLSLLADKARLEKKYPQFKTQ